MADTSFFFQMTPYDTARLLPQVSRALEKRTELLSRKRYPGLWQQTDRLEGAARQPSAHRQSKAVSILCLALGVFLLVPGVMKPREMPVALLAGMLGLIVGAAGLWRGRRPKESPFDRSARFLLEGLGGTGTNGTVRFTDAGMLLAADGREAEAVAYERFECVVETADAWLMVFDERIMLLQKKDGAADSTALFSDFLKARVPACCVLP